MIRLFVGAAANGEDAESCAVLEYSARKHTTGPLEITWLMQTHDRRSPLFGWNTSGWITPFSGFRWAIPELCGFKGRALYMDSDMIVRADLRRLWAMPIPKPAIGLARVEGRKLRTCVTLFDCARARNVLPPIRTLREMKDPKKRVRPEDFWPMEPGWNCVDLRGVAGVDDPRLKILHYSAMESQPHLAMAAERLARRGLVHWYDGPRTIHPRIEVPSLFLEQLREAEAAGFRVSNYEPAVPFGEYSKRSLAEKPLKGHR